MRGLTELGYISFGGFWALGIIAVVALQPSVSLAPLIVAGALSLWVFDNLMAKLMLPSKEVING